MDRPHGRRRHSCREVGSGNHALVPCEIARVHLGHDQWHVGRHAEGRRVVDHDRARIMRRRYELAAPPGTSAEEGEVQALEGVGFHLLDRIGLARELQGLARRAGRREKLD